MPTEPPWKGTEHEVPLQKLSRKRKGKAFPPDATGQLQFANYIYGVVKTVGRHYRGDSREDIERRKATGQRLGLRERPPIPPPPKQAGIYRQVATQFMRAAERIEPLQPQPAEQLQCLAQTLTDEADLLKQYARGRKRHTEHPETRRIRELMDLIYYETGKYHDHEVSELLKLQGLHQYTPNYLCSLRSKFRHKTNLKATQVANQSQKQN